MFDFLKKDKPLENKIDNLVELACLLLHASKIDQNFTSKEELIIKKTLINFGAKESDLNKILIDAEKIEENSNQILNFTKNLKNVEYEKKIMIVQSLWEIIYSDSESDMYESNLMRRLTGLLYLDAKEVGDIKEKIKNQLNR